MANGEFLEYYPAAVDPLRTEMFQPILKPDADGYITVPDRPGIGYELNMDLLNRYRVGVRQTGRYLVKSRDAAS